MKDSGILDETLSERFLEKLESDSDAPENASKMPEKGLFLSFELETEFWDMFVRRSGAESRKIAFQLDEKGRLRKHWTN